MIDTRQILINQIVEKKPQLFVTFQTNDIVSLHNCRSKLSLFDYRMSDACFGGGFHKTSNEYKRFISFMFPENGLKTSKSHIHGLYVFPYQPETNIETFKKKANTIWRFCCSKGNIDVKTLETVEDIRKAASYATKTFWRDRQEDNWFLNTEFRK